MTRYAMVIDRQRCVGCGGCIIACKQENNLPEGINWSYKITETSGTFPDVRFNYLPTLCNHCKNAPCVRGCPTSALYKDDNGLTMHNPDKCIGCKYCMINCPYGVISFNWEAPHKPWKDKTPLLKGITSSPEEVTKASGGNTIPYYNSEREDTLDGIRPKGVVEKCTFCDHRVKKGELPYCVEACPSDARIFGDVEDPNSSVSKLLGKYKPDRLKEHLGTEPQVYYIRSYNPAEHNEKKGGV
ncbi:MAG: 4Fe-4S dicluster domain-containing protein [Desulfamplus sp.]|nr:4Fe-4S dicluster domain-containing protein [Desulfamplus sp.]